MNTAAKVGISIFFILALYMTLQVVDNEMFDGKFRNKIRYGSDCAFVVPKGFKIVYSGKDRNYAVQDLSMEDHYLHGYFSGIYSLYSSIRIPSKFSDSCEAKAFLKHYIIQESPKMQDYK